MPRPYIFRPVLAKDRSPDHGPTVTTTVTSKEAGETAQSLTEWYGVNYTYFPVPSTAGEWQ